MPSSSDIYNSTNDPYGYGIVNTGANAAKRATSDAFGKAVGYLQSGQQQGMGYLTDAYKQAQTYYQPQLQASYSALDHYLDLVGVPRYKQGSGAYQQANQELKGITDKMDGIKGEMSRREQEIASKLNDIRAMEAEVRNSGGHASVADSAKKKLSAAWNEYNSLSQRYDQDRGNLWNQYNQLQTQVKDFQSNDPRMQMTNAQEAQQGVLEGLQSTPGYQFQLKQGTNAIQNSAAAKGMLQSGRAMKSLDQFSQDLAGTYYQKAVDNAAGMSNSLNQFPLVSSQLDANRGNAGMQGYLQTGTALGNAATGYGSDMGNINLAQSSALNSIYQANRQIQMAGGMMNNYSQAYNSGLVGGR